MELSNFSRSREGTIVYEAKIAVVDKDPLSREFVVNVMMYSINREVMSFEDGEAFEAYMRAGGTVHIVLSEIHLPGKSGIDLFHWVKKESPQTSFIAMSPNPADETAAEEAGVDAFLAKPFALQDLFDIVKNFVVGE
jgi:DNA-binding NtrC family response regulator